jgi:citrate lyase subunit beta/citryl-CoA lyase
MTGPTGQLRSLLYVPAHRSDWVEKALVSGADALIFDLEDAVPLADKAEATQICRSSIEAAGGRAVVMVRINPVAGERWLDDLEAIVVAGLSGVLLPKCERPEHVGAADLVLSQLERRAGLEVGSISLTPMFESGPGIDQAKEIMSASPRVRYCWAGHTRDGDLGRDLSLGWSAEGRESLYARSKVIVDARVAGVRYPTTGIWADVKDLDGLRAFAEQSALIGFSGIQIIHPGHAATVNDVLTPDAGEVARLERIVIAMHQAAGEGLGAITLDGAMVDEAMSASAGRRLRDARDLGVPVSSEAREIIGNASGKQ